MENKFFDSMQHQLEVVDLHLKTLLISYELLAKNIFEELPHDIKNTKLRDCVDFSNRNSVRSAHKILLREPSYRETNKTNSWEYTHDHKLERAYNGMVSQIDLINKHMRKILVDYQAHMCEEMAKLSKDQKVLLIKDIIN